MDEITVQSAIDLAKMASAKLESGDIDGIRRVGKSKTAAPA